MKLLTVIISIVVSLTLVSCYSSADSTRALEKLYPKAEIYQIDCRKYIMFDSIGVYYLKDIGIKEPDFSKALIKKY